MRRVVIQTSLALTLLLLSRVEAINRLTTGLWPGFPSDMVSLVTVLATQAEGETLIHDWMYELRLFALEQLSGMRADLFLCDPHRIVVSGPTKLRGRALDSRDLRSGMALIAAALATVVYLDMPAIVVVQQTAAGAGITSLLAIPLFIFAGEMMMRGGISDRLIALAAALVGHLRGGLGQVNVLASLFFGGVSGSAIADVSAIGGTMIPQMVQRKYDRDFAVNVSISAAIVALLVPPSHNLILFSAAAGGGLSIADLFAAGIVPALLMTFAMMVTGWFIARRRGYGLPLRSCRGRDASDACLLSPGRRRLFRPLGRSGRAPGRRPGTGPGPRLFRAHRERCRGRRLVRALCTLDSLFGRSGHGAGRHAPRAHLGLGG